MSSKYLFSKNPSNGSIYLQIRYFISEEIMLEPDASKYFFINQGKLTIDKVDDAQEMRDTKKAFDILLFTQVIIFSNLNFF